MRLPCTITIAGSDSGGGAGIEADLKTFAALNVHGLCVLTAVTAQNTLGVEDVFELPSDFVLKQLDAVMKDFDAKWAKTGMLSNAEIIKAVKSGIKKYELKVVADPVMIAATGAPLLKRDAVEAMKDFLSCVELVTPNLPEAEMLSGLKIKSMHDMRKAAKEISKLGAYGVIIKGGHMPTSEAVDLIYFDGKFIELKSPRIRVKGATHGTGCSFSAAITAELANGKGIIEAVKSAKEFITHAIAKRLEVGKGVKPVNPMASLIIDAEKGRCLEEVWKAAQMLVSDQKFTELLPEVGSNIAVALYGAEKVSGVVGLSGRIVKVSGKAQLTGFPTLGGSEHVANVALTAMRYDPKIRAAMNIRFSDKIIRACRRLNLKIAEFRREEEPKGVKTMVWGTEQAIRKMGGVPDIIFDRGAPGKEAMVRILGRSALDVAETALKISKML